MGAMQDPGSTLLSTSMDVRINSSRRRRVSGHKEQGRVSDDNEKTHMGAMIPVSSHPDKRDLTKKSVYHRSSGQQLSSSSSTCEKQATTGTAAAITHSKPNICSSSPTSFYSSSTTTTSSTTKLIQPSSSCSSGYPAAAHLSSWGKFKCSPTISLTAILLLIVAVSCCLTATAAAAGNRVSRSAFNDPRLRFGSNDAAIAASAAGGRRARREAPALLINPSGESHRIHKGKPFVLNCLGNQNPDQFSDLEWFDPNGNKISPGKDFTTSLTNRRDRLQLIFRNPNTRQDGLYTCRGKFRDGTALEASVPVSVFDGVSWKDCPTTQALVKGRESQEIRCGAESNPQADITWIKDESLLDQRRYAIQTSGIQIKGPTEERDRGTYTIMATVQATGGLETRVINVEVHSRPVITEIRDSVDVVEGEAAELRCTAQAVPYATYSWLDASNRNLSNADGYTVNSETGGLKIGKVSKVNDRGAFTCVASNAAGKDVRGTNLKIITKPVITQLVNASLNEGSEAVISCTATGNPVPRLSVKREGEQEIMFDDKIRINVVDMPAQESNTLHVSIKNIRRSDAGHYICIAENQAGRTESTYHLEVNFQPDLNRTETHVMSWHQNVKNITCYADAIPNATIIWYDGKTMQRIADDTRYRVFAHPSGGESNLQVTSLDNSVYTDYRCQAINRLGVNEVNIRLEEAFVPSVAEGISVIKKSPQSVTFKYETMAKNGGLPVTRYHVNYSEMNTGLDPRIKSHSWSVASASDVLFLENLHSETEYEFKFAAENPVGVGEFGNQLTVYLPRESQPEPVNIHMDRDVDQTSGDLLSSYSREFTVRWSEPNDNGRRIESYDIKYYKVKKSSSEWQQDGDVFRSSVSPGDSLTYTLSSLSPSTHYKIEISARNALGSSHPTSLIFQTARFKDETELDAELVISSSNVIILITIFVLAVLLFLVILDLICCFGFNAGLIRFCCGSSESGESGNGSTCCCPCFGSSTRRSIRSGASSIQKEDPEDHDHLNGHTHHHNHHVHHHPPPHHHHVLNHPHAQAKGDAV